VFHCATFHILRIFLVFCLTFFTKTCIAELGFWEIIKAIGTFLLYVLWSSLLLIYAKWALCSKLYTSITIVFPYFIQIRVDLNSYLNIFSQAFLTIGTLWVWKFNRIQIIFTCCASPKITAFWFHLNLLRNCQVLLAAVTTNWRSQVIIICFVYCFTSSTLPFFSFWLFLNLI
jgi:hypothetical protein